MFCIFSTPALPAAASCSESRTVGRNRSRVRSYIICKIKGKSGKKRGRDDLLWVGFCGVSGTEPERRGINKMFFVSQIQNTFHVLTVILKYDLQD